MSEPDPPKSAVKSYYNSERFKQYYRANHERRLENTRKWRAKNQAKIKAYSLKYNRANKDRCAAWCRKTLYGLSTAQYQEMLSKQRGLCAICGNQMKKINVDHDHKTGKVRELLCFTCNSMLGCSKDSPDLLLAGVSYLQKHK